LYNIFRGGTRSDGGGEAGDGTPVVKFRWAQFFEVFI